MSDPWVIPPTYGPNTIFTSTEANDISTDLEWLYAPPSGRNAAGGPTGVNPATWTVVGMVSGYVAGYGMSSTASGFQVPVGGHYRVSAAVAWEFTGSPPSGEGQLAIIVNGATGSPSRIEYKPLGSLVCMAITDTLTLSAGDLVQSYVYQNSGGLIHTNGDGTTDYLSIELFGGV